MTSGGKARILTFGFTGDESAAIDAALAEIRVPAPTRLRPSQAGCRVGDIVDRDADGAGSLDSGERLEHLAEEKRAHEAARSSGSAPAGGADP